MEVRSTATDYSGQRIIIEEVKFGDVLYVYIGDEKRQFTDMSVALPQGAASSHLLGEKADDLAEFLTEIMKKPVLASYGLSLQSEADATRFNFVKGFLRRHFTTNSQSKV